MELERLGELFDETMTEWETWQETFPQESAILFARRYAERFGQESTENLLEALESMAQPEEINQLYRRAGWGA